MSRISLLVSDVDGTLVDDAKALTPATIEAAAALKAAGTKLSLVSSRPPMGFAYLVEPLKLEAPLGAFNGGTILQPDMSVIARKTVPAAAARTALAAFAAFGLEAWLFTNRAWCLTDPDGAYVPLERRTVRGEPERVASFDALLDDVGKLVGSSQDFGRVAACERDLRARLGSAADARRSQAYYLDVTPVGADKGAAVRHIAELLSVPLDEVAVIGDMANDSAMFEVAPHRIAMGNAIDELKRRATFVTGSNAADGWARAVREYVLPRSPRAGDVAPA